MTRISLCRALLGATLLFAAHLSYAASEFRVDLEFNPAAPFPFLGKFGKIDLSVYPGGVRGATTFFEGYSRNGSNQVTLMSPYSRVYSDVTVSELRQLVRTLSRSETEVLPRLGTLKIAGGPLKGAVRGVPATRYRVILGTDAWLDIWTTNVVPKNAQFHALEMQFVSAISSAAARTAATIPGMPIYVELHTRRFEKVPLLRLIRIFPTSEGENEALSVGSFYVRSPILNLLLK